MNGMYWEWQPHKVAKNRRGNPAQEQALKSPKRTISIFMAGFAYHEIGLECRRKQASAELFNRLFRQNGNETHIVDRTAA